MKTYPRPKFVREESWRYKRVKQSWRSPRGKTSRVRRSKEGWPPVVKIGYSKPASLRGLHPSGMKEIMIHRPQDLEKINPKVHVARIAHAVGENKRLLILAEAEKRNIRVLNPGPKREEPVVPPTEEATTAEKEGETDKETETTPEAKPKPATKKKKGRKSAQ